MQIAECISIDPCNSSRSLLVQSTCPSSPLMVLLTSSKHREHLCCIQTFSWSVFDTIVFSRNNGLGGLRCDDYLYHMRGLDHSRMEHGLIRNHFGKFSCYFSFGFDD